eukprot:TRINITY_DN54871_c0_g1_i1.p1 TRINITY_DN54871_c0_g1~~TRINITY_DN54871_c0_g1_i1.p1  ORF type:complete len:561 (-),score=51.27 TRINITY_DN54871_c0_g1_i1:19-1578(-)
MRFNRKEMELAYVKSVEAEVVRWMCIGTGGALFAIIPMTIWILSLQLSREDVPFTWHFEDPRTFLVAGWALIGVNCFTYSAIAQCRLRLGWFQWINFELGAVLFSSYGLMTATLITLKTVPVMYGKNPLEVWAMPLEDGSTTMALMTCGILAGTCMMVPVRCIYLWIVPTMVVLSYTVSVAITDLLTFPLDIVILCVVAMFVTFGARRNEANLRDKFLVTHQERQATQEKEAFSCLLEMVCECAIWIGEDGKTIMRSHRWLDFFMEQLMEGKSIYEALADEGGQRHRLRELLQLNKGGQLGEETMPVRLLQTKFTSHHSEVDVDLFVADRRQFSTSWGEHHLAFLIGIRCHADPGLLEMVGQQPSRMGMNGPAADPVLGVAEDPSSESGTSSTHTPLQTAAAAIVALPSTSEVLVCLEDDKLRPVPVSSVRIGDKLYCSSCDRDPVLMPVAVVATSFVESLECNNIGVGEHAGAMESLKLVEDNCICLHIGGQRFRWTPATAANFEIPHTGPNSTNYCE